MSDDALSALLDVTALLAEPGDLDATLEAAARALVPRVACFCAIDVLAEDGALRRVAIVHRDPDKAETVARLRSLGPPNPDAENGVHNLLRSGKSHLTPQVTAEGLARGARSPEHLALMLDCDPRSGMIVPLRARGRSRGILWLFGGALRAPFGPEDLRVGEGIGECLALAIDNAFLAKRAEEAVSERDEFLSIASHELRTPLTSLTLQLEALQRGMVPPDRVADRLRAAARQTERLGKLVRVLLDLPRSPSPLDMKRVRMDLAKTARDVAASVEEDARRAGCDLRVAASEPVIGRWDLLRIEQMILNLVSNALKYGRGAPIDVAVEKRGERARLTVIDRGIGIAPADHARIFQRFERAAPARGYGGLGLGLYIAREIVEAESGTIAVDSRPGQGATFVVELPVQEKE